ncbi:NAD(P)-dependent oxidoreductase [Pseudonocardia nigra]|uniref:NAD(P)-dependent oxidoreductase n=1 Tax=Pseudonocardia nigra TaxID=1921578 RepID=UPI001C5D617D|nr:NAD(P)-binding domain-containing protein [Pseudonocardia nigra]
MTEREDAQPVAVLGLGALGSVVAGALLKAGHPTTVWNRSPGRAADLVGHGAIPAATLAEAATASPVVVLAVADADAVRAVLEPVADALAGRVVVNLTSGRPEQARDLAAWTARRGGTYLDGAAMSGTRAVGRPEALFLYSGSRETFDSAGPALRSLGRARYLGADPGTASLHDTALLGVNLGLLTGFYHAVALLGGAGVPAPDVAEVVTDYLPFAQGLLAEHARQAELRTAPPDEGTLEVLAAAVDHLVATSAGLGIGTDVPDGIRALLERGLRAGHGRDGLPSLVGVIAGTEVTR